MRIKYLTIIVVVAVLLSGCAHSYSALNISEISFLPFGKPIPACTCLSKTAFVIGHDGEKRQPRWVAYWVSSETADLPGIGKRKFVPDPELPESENAKDSDYAKSGYDRGHMAPYASVRRKGNPLPECESCYFSNICPQKPSLNQGIWKALENKERMWAKRYEKVWITTGPIFGEDGNTVPSGRVAVPMSFYKIIMQAQDGQLKALSYIIPQSVTKQDRNLKCYLVSIDDIEKATGIDFFSELPDDVENKMEAEVPCVEWPE